MRRIEHSVVVTCGIEAAFHLYTDYNFWRHRSVFGDLRWVDGEPWKQGSRMQVEIKGPFWFTANEVVVRHSPFEHVGFISHGMGVTIEHNVYFSREPGGGGTLIRVEIQVGGPTAFVLGFAVAPTLEAISREQFAAFKQECDAMTASEG
jgi:hypothetical protein